MKASSSGQAEPWPVTDAGLESDYTPGPKGSVDSPNQLPIWGLCCPDSRCNAFPILLISSNMLAFVRAPARGKYNKAKRRSKIAGDGDRTRDVQLGKLMLD